MKEILLTKERATKNTQRYIAPSDEPLLDVVYFNALALKAAFGTLPEKIHVILKGSMEK